MGFLKTGFQFRQTIPLSLLLRQVVEQPDGAQITVGGVEEPFSRDVDGYRQGRGIRERLAVECDFQFSRGATSCPTLVQPETPQLLLLRREEDRVMLSREFFWAVPKQGGDGRAHVDKSSFRVQFI